MDIYPIQEPTLLAAAPAYLLAALRRATRQDHHALDHHPRLNRLIRPGLDRAGYADSLLALSAAQAVLEARVTTELATLGHGYAIMPRMPSLEDDLARLAAAPLSPDGHMALQATGEGALIGRLYVLEGARLGAEPIAARVRAALGEDAPLAYFGTAEGERHWPAFLAFAARGEVDDDMADNAAIAAQEAFALFHAALDRRMPVPETKHV
ncbi:biliverdin-producing heme oxygenase [Halomonas urumqiensis]|uniref:Heme oxygenase n=1 Tax=Halomonas urumqiensis TaxID=1684789 RepID=A0A2N7UNP0_9GAMM|nr:biliverdin-producing heme oxygenase [Halomonas urumqiensis]PMR82022.1 hypothetical protein C1H70_02130 [Halomonas urumqiensis]PTB02646.1 hypothetical protein C6V82_08335 [Halomonas urumqiensis]GHE21131.1 hypothetical protein GCM10017767_16520 [Halomonas urumqiensis]